MTLSRSRYVVTAHLARGLSLMCDDGINIHTDVSSFAARLATILVHIQVAVSTTRENVCTWFKFTIIMA